MKIQNYTQDGFTKVCDVIIHRDYSNQWDFINVDYNFVGDEHQSWIYFIVNGDDIMKCGESGNPLLLETKGKNPRWKKGTKSRLGRYMNGCTTDTVIRQELEQEVSAGTVSIWAKRLPVSKVQVSIGGQQKIVERSIHKDLEMVYLDHFVEEHGALPPLNKGRK
tara:strand:- start:2244 stop:2735 length:492 start_codon:yes stop_codon:yes gene_type:complete